MKSSLAAIALVAGAAASSAMAGVELYNNGPMITHPGGGFGGANASMCPLAFNTAGFASVAAGFASKVGDDFTVPAGGWTVNSIVTYAYMTSTYPNPPATPITGALVEIWNGAPNAGGVVIHSSNAIVSNNFTGIYRVFNGAANLTNAQRPVFEVEVSFPSINLAAGNYWVTYGFTGLSPTGGTTGFSPLVTTLDGTGAPVHANGNGVNFFTGVWTVTTGGTPIQGVAYPFIVNGVPAPGALALLALGGLAAARRRR
jgi:hypothetical protein